MLFYASATKPYLLTNVSLKLVNDLARSSESRGVGNQNWLTVCANKMRKISSLGWQVLKSNDRIVAQDTHSSRVRGQHQGQPRVT